MSCPTYVKDPQEHHAGQDVIASQFQPASRRQSAHATAVANDFAAPDRQGGLAKSARQRAASGRTCLFQPASTLAGDPAAAPRSYPLMAAVEQKPVRRRRQPARQHAHRRRGRFIFSRQPARLNAAANRDFVSYAANWLLDRTMLLAGIGPRPVTEFRLMMTRNQQSKCPLAAARRAARRRAGSSAGWSGWCAENNEHENHMDLVRRRGGVVRVHFAFEPLPAPADPLRRGIFCPVCSRHR